MSASDLPIRVVFFQVRDTKLKLQRLVEIAQTHFEKNDPFLIFVEDAKAQTFVDDLLWKLPETSFLPHISTDDTTKELIAITKSKANINQARAAFNLCPTPLLLTAPIRLIYEFEDLTSPAKKELSSLRFDAYKQSHCLIEAVTA